MQQVVVPPFLVGTRVNLRPLDVETDLDACWRWINDPEIRQFVKRRRPATREEEREWFATPKPNDIVLGIELKPQVLGTPGRLIGNTALHRINWPQRHATSGTLIGEKDCWGCGYGTEAKMLLLRYAFLTLNLHRVTSNVYATNERSLRCQKRCGYREEGRLREMFFINGRWVDVVTLGVLQREWLWQFDREAYHAASLHPYTPPCPHPAGTSIFTPHGGH